LTKRVFRYIIEKGGYSKYIQDARKDIKMTYSPSEVCETFDIAKSTLYRWEQDGKIPPASRKLSGEREYSEDHIKKIAEIKRDMLTREYQRASQTEDIDRMKQIHEASSQIKALYLNDLTGLCELAEYGSLPNKTIKELLIKASNLEPKDQLFRGIVELLHFKCHALE